MPNAALLPAFSVLLPCCAYTYQNRRFPTTVRWLGPEFARWRRAYGTGVLPLGFAHRHTVMAVTTYYRPACGVYDLLSAACMACSWFLRRGAEHHVGKTAAKKAGFPAPYACNTRRAFNLLKTTTLLTQAI